MSRDLLRRLGSSAQNAGRLPAAPRECGSQRPKPLDRMILELAQVACLFSARPLRLLLSDWFSSTKSTRIARGLPEKLLVRS